MFASLNQKPFTERQANVIDLNQYTTETVGKMLEFFYTGKLCKSDISELQGVCEKLGIMLQVADASSLNWNDECLRKDNMVLEAMASEDEDALVSLYLEIPNEEKDKVVVKKELENDWIPGENKSIENNSVVSSTSASKKNNTRSSAKVVSQTISRKEMPKVDTGVVVKTESNEFLDLSDYICNFCKMPFTSLRRLNNHKWVHYQTDGGSYQCNVCSKTFPIKDGLRKHLTTHTLKCKSFICPICNHRFLFLSRLQNHMNTHTNAKPFMCDICGRCFNDRDYLSKHKRIHREDRRYLCGTCGKRFVMNNAYKTHLLTHTGEKPFKCDLCFQRFTQRHSLKVHMLLHNNEAPYKCSSCPRRFRRAARLKIHILTVHTDNADKPFHCQLCNKGFSTKCYLQQHMLTHNRTCQCTACGKNFTGTSKRKSDRFCSECISEQSKEIDSS